VLRQKNYHNQRVIRKTLDCLSYGSNEKKGKKGGKKDEGVREECSDPQVFTDLVKKLRDKIMRRGGFEIGERLRYSNDLRHRGRSG
jgi:hypothetical protein